MDIREVQAATIIQSAAVASKVMAAGFAQVSFTGIDRPVLRSISAAMILSLGSMFDGTLDKSTAFAISRKFSRTAIVVNTAKALMGFMPILGNAANARIVHGVTEGAGWGVYQAFLTGKDIEILSANEIKDCIKKGRLMSKPNIAECRNQMSIGSTGQYDRLTGRLQDLNLPAGERKKILDDLVHVMQPYLGEPMPNTI